MGNLTPFVRGHPGENSVRYAVRPAAMRLAPQTLWVKLALSPKVLPRWEDDMASHVLRCIAKIVRTWMLEGSASWATVTSCAHLQPAFTQMF
jgi:hypothetical protein